MVSLLENQSFCIRIYTVFMMSELMDKSSRNTPEEQ